MKQWIVLFVILIGVTACDGVGDSPSDDSGSYDIVITGGLVVAPGFINIHSHSWTPLGQEFELRDGVTTALELEA